MLQRMHDLVTHAIVPERVDRFRCTLGPITASAMSLLSVVCWLPKCHCNSSSSLHATKYSRWCYYRPVFSAAVRKPPSLT